MENQQIYTENYIKLCEWYAVFSLYRCLTDKVFEHQIENLKNVDPEEMKGSNKSLFQTMLFFEKQGIPIDVNTIYSYINTNSENTINIDVEDLKKYITREDFQNENFNKIITDLSAYQKKQKLKRYVSKLLNEVIETPELKVNDKIEQIKNDLNFFTSQKSTLISQHDVLMNLYSRLKHNYENNIDVTIKTGYNDFDNLVKLKRKQLVTIAGRPAMGKTVFMTNLNKMFRQQDYGVLFYSLEMDNEELLMREVQAELGVNNLEMEINFGKYEKAFKMYINKKEKHTKTAFLSEDSYLHIFDIEKHIDEQRAKGVKIDVIIIDYLGLIESLKSFNRNDEIGKMTRFLKLLAKRKDVLIIQLAQLSRKVEDRAVKIPQMADLRDSGSIEQDSDIVLFLYRPFYYYPEKLEDKNLLEVHIAKQRGFSTGKVNLSIDMIIQKISSIEKFD